MAFQRADGAGTVAKNGFGGRLYIAGAKSSQATSTRDKYKIPIIQEEPANHANCCHTNFIWLQAADKYQSVQIWIQSINTSQTAGYQMHMME